MKVKTYALELQAFQVEALLPIVIASVKKMTTSLGVTNVVGGNDPALASKLLGLQDVQDNLERLAKQVARAEKKAEGVTINVQ